MKKSLTIVIADDEALLRLDLREMLEEAGHRVAGEAADGYKAVELAKKYKPDLVIMDVKMPRMDGLVAAKKISEARIAPVLLLTAFSQQNIVEKAKEAGVLAYLVKPIQESNLFPAIEIAVSRWEEMEGLQDELEKLKESLEMRKILDRAKGILMEAHGISEVEAYRRIRQYAMKKQKSIKEIAEAVVRAAK